jgi:hypothetical protein
MAGLPQAVLEILKRFLARIRPTVKSLLLLWSALQKQIRRLSRRAGLPWLYHASSQSRPQNPQTDTNITSLTPKSESAQTQIDSIPRYSVPPTSEKPSVATICYGRLPGSEFLYPSSQHPSRSSQDLRSSSRASGERHAADFRSSRHSLSRASSPARRSRLELEPGPSYLGPSRLSRSRASSPVRGYLSERPPNNTFLQPRPSSWLGLTMFTGSNGANTSSQDLGLTTIERYMPENPWPYGAPSTRQPSPLMGVGELPAEDDLSFAISHGSEQEASPKSHTTSPPRTASPDQAFFRDGLLPGEGIAHGRWESPLKQAYPTFSPCAPEELRRYERGITMCVLLFCFLERFLSDRTLNSMDDYTDLTIPPMTNSFDP